MAGAKRTNTKPGMGSVRSSRPPRKSKRPPPITVPSIKMPRVENVGDRAPDSGSSRGTLKRVPSSDKTAAQIVRTPSSRVAPGVVPVVTPNAATRL